MPSKLPDKKVGIVACSGEELAEGTVTRLAALKVLEQLRPSETVTICLPLFLAGGEGDRAFARFYPTIALDGCAERCAARATEKYSNKPAAEIVVTDILAGRGMPAPCGLRRLNEAGEAAVDAVAGALAAEVDRLMEARWSRVRGEAIEPEPQAEPAETEAACSCGSGIPITVLEVNSRRVELMALPPIFDQFQAQGLAPDGDLTPLISAVRLYNPLPDGPDTPAILDAIRQAYAEHWRKEATR